MKRIWIGLCLLFILAVPVSAISFEAPQAPDEAQKYIQTQTESFGEGLWYVICTTVASLRPELQQAASCSIMLIAVAALTGFVQNTFSAGSSVCNLVGILSVACILFKSSHAFIHLGIRTVKQLSEYGKMLLPVMTSALAAQGCTATAAAIYGATAIFDTLLCSGIQKLMVPMLYIYICMSIMQSITHHDTIKQIRAIIKWAMTWVLKISLYLFTGYLTITGVISGNVDASAVKAAKIAISGSVPVVGGIISDASEAILVSAGVMKNAAGMYGILALIAVFLMPFLTIGIQHLCLKFTAALCGLLGSKECVELVEDFSSVMSFLLAMTGTICLLHLISTVCFMKGVS